jgi:hypothetical protein
LNLRGENNFAFFYAKEKQNIRKLIGLKIQILKSENSRFVISRSPTKSNFVSKTIFTLLFGTNMTNVKMTVLGNHISLDYESTITNSYA